MVLTNALIIAILIFTRISAIFSLMPFFGATNIPMQVRIAFMMFLTVLLYPITNAAGVAQVLTFWDLGFHIVIETLIGLSISIAAAIVYNAIYLAGTIIDTGLGFSMINVISATDETEMPLTANFYYLLAIIVFMATNCHHLVIEAIWQCFRLVPVAGGVVNLQVTDLFNVFLVQSFILGIKIAAPFMLTMLVTDVIMGLLSKAMPGFNVFMVGMPIKILIGFVLIFILVPYMVGISRFLNDQIIQYMNDVIQLYRGGS